MDPGNQARSRSGALEQDNGVLYMGLGLGQCGYGVVCRSWAQDVGRRFPTSHLFKVERLEL